MSDSFSLYEDNLNQVMDQLRKIIKTFTTLSKEKAESALTNATSLIKQGDSLLRQMKLEISSNPSLSSLTSKVKNFNNEFDNLKLSFEKVQNSYISKKAENAIILGTDKSNTQTIDQKIELIENEDNMKESQKEEKVEIHNIFDSKEDKNDIMQSLPDENDLNIKIGEKNHKKMIIVIVIIIVVLIVGIGVLGVVLGKKNNNN